MMGNEHHLTVGLAHVVNSIQPVAMKANNNHLSPREELVATLYPCPTNKEHHPI